MINYLIELAVVHLTLGFVYWVFLRKENQYTLLRAFIISVYVLSLIVPLLEMPETWTYENPKIIQQSSEVTAIMLKPVVASAENASFASFASSAFIWIYVLISGWFVLQIISSLYNLLKLMRCSKMKLESGEKVFYSQKIIGSFTFFHWIFISPTIINEQSTYQAILSHELSHVRLRHSYDILIMQLFRALFWWLPTSWYLLAEMKKIHEYQADTQAIKSFDVSVYIKTLISQTLNVNGINLASSFHDGHTLKRIKAMKRKISKIKTWKISAISMVVLLVLFGLSCNEQLDADIKAMGANSNSITFDQLPENMQNNLADLKDQLSFTKVTISEEELKGLKNKKGLDFESIEQLKDIDPSLIHSMNVNKDQSEIILAMKKDGANFNYVAERSKSDHEVFTVVEQIPEYPGGMDVFYQYIASEIKYPENARKEGIEGRVYVQFIVEKDGSLSGIKTIRGIGGGCDEEAERVLSGAQKFTPGSQRGKKVRVRMVLPVIFSLDRNKTIEEGNGVIAIDKVKAQNSKMKVKMDWKNGVCFGTIFDAESGEVLQGVNIVESSTNIGTVSDPNGNFKLRLSDESHPIVMSFVGYESVEISK
jgi:TonB family protein